MSIQSDNCKRKTQLAASLSEGELNAVLENVRQIASAISLEINRKTASIPNKRVIDCTKEYMNSKSFKNAKRNG